MTAEYWNVIWKEFWLCCTRQCVFDCKCWCFIGSISRMELVCYLPWKFCNNPVKQSYYWAFIIHPCDQHIPSSPAPFYEWQNLTRGQFRFGCHWSPDISSKREECGQIIPQLHPKEHKKTLMHHPPYHNKQTLHPLPFLVVAVIKMRGSGAAVERAWLGGTDMAVFDVKVASPLLVMRDPWRPRLALI